MFFSHSFLPLHFLGSDLHCCLSEQLVGLLCDPGSTLPHTLLVGWASSGFLRWGHSPAQKPLRLHYFPENEIGKHKVQVIFTDLCVTVFNTWSACLWHVLTFLSCCLSSWVWNDIKPDSVYHMCFYSARPNAFPHHSDPWNFSLLWLHKDFALLILNVFPF